MVQTSALNVGTVAFGETVVDGEGHYRYLRSISLALDVTAKPWVEMFSPGSFGHADAEKDKRMRFSRHGGSLPVRPLGWHWRVPLVPCGRAVDEFVLVFGPNFGEDYTSVAQ